MNRKTLSDLKDPTQSEFAAIANVSPSDSRFTALANRCTENLVKTKEKFWGLHQRVQFCVNSGCLVLPRQIASLETVAICDQPIPVRNRWFEWLETGLGLAGEGNCRGDCHSPQLLDRGNTCCFADIIGTNKKIKVYADVSEDADAVIRLQGYDANAQWVRTEVDGEWIDGEEVSISTTPVTSTKFFSALTGVQKPITNGTVRLYEYNTDDTTQRAIAVFEPDETRPSYRKFFIPGLENQKCCGCDGSEENQIQVTVMAKLEFIPVRRDTDWLLIGNFGALEAELQSVMKRRNNLLDEAVSYHALAIQMLRDELRHYAGSGAVAPMRFPHRSLAGPSVHNLI